MKLMQVLVAVVLLCGMSRAQGAPQGATAAAADQSVPAGSTGRCNDGSYSTARQKWQACRGHKGVQTWFATGSSTGQAPAAPHTTATGADAGKVWVNLDTRVYHCPGGKFYGKTKKGQYMSEAEAKKAGARPDRNKPCGL